MYLIVRTSDLPSLPRRCARVIRLPRGTLHRPVVVEDHALVGEHLLEGRCGCDADAPPLGAASSGRRGTERGALGDPELGDAAMMGEVLSPDDAAFMGELGPNDLESRRLARRIEALEVHVDVLARALERRDAAAREQDEAFERAEDRVFDALAELCSAALERWRRERHLARRR